MRRHDDAVRHFSTCIRLEPSNEIYYSNRAAAHTALKNFRGALSDGKEVVRLKPRWAKGWARIAAAHFGLEEFQEVSTQGMPAIPWRSTGALVVKAVQAPPTLSTGTSAACSGTQGLWKHLRHPIMCLSCFVV